MKTLLFKQYFVSIYDRIAVETESVHDSFKYILPQTAVFCTLNSSSILKDFIIRAVNLASESLLGQKYNLLKASESKKRHYIFNGLKKAEQSVSKVIQQNTQKPAFQSKCFRRTQKRHRKHFSG